MYKILIIAPYTKLVAVINEMRSLFEPNEIIVRVGIFDDVLPHLEEAKRLGVDAIVARGATARLIQTCSDIPVVEVASDQLDVFKSINQLKSMEKKIGVLWYSKIPGEETLLFDDANVNIRCFDYISRQDLEEAIAQAYNEGIQVLLGGVYSIYLAEKYGMRGILIEISKEALGWSIQQALNLCVVKKQEEIRRVMAETIIDSVHDAILAIDKDSKVMVCNPQARKILRLGDDQAVTGKHIQEIMPSSKLVSVLENQKEEFADIQDLGSMQIMATRAPMILNNEVIGAVETFQDVTEVQRNEHKIRFRAQKQGFSAKWTFDAIVAKSSVMQECIKTAEIYANSEGSLIIHGETGVGKEVIAQSIHNSSPVCKGPFVAVNCAALPENLLESELFGYDEGAFSGSRKGGKMGLFELAHGGTLFLDEIAEISTSIQARLLRALQEKSIMRIGGDRIIPVDVRIVSATNVELLPLVMQGGFRKDIYYRLSMFTVRIPPLRDRTEDILELANEIFAKSTGLSIVQSKRIIDSVNQYLLSYDWPGNVRELQNVVERFSLLSRLSNNYETSIVSAIGRTESVHDIITVPFNQLQGDLKDMLKDVEKAILKKMIGRYNQDIPEVCRILNISRTSFWRKYKSDQ